MSKEIICGIYKITSPSGRVYIGESKDIGYRLKTYRKLRCKNQTKLYNSFLKYGVDAHIFSIIEECLFEELLCKERYWQDFYDVLNDGLNLKLTECGGQKQIHSQETVLKIKSNHSLKGVKGIDNPFSKKCYQYSLEGFFIKEWDSITDVERNLKLSNSLIVRCLKGKTRTAHKFQWFYEYKGDIIEPILIKSCKNNTRNPELLEDIKKEYNNNKNLNLVELAKSLDISYQKIRNMWYKHKNYIIKDEIK